MFRVRPSHFIPKISWQTHDDVGYKMSSDENEYSSGFHKKSNYISNRLAIAGDKILQSKAFQVITLGHLHTLVHEMGHSTAAALFGLGRSEITISTQTLAGETTYSDWPANKWQDTVTNAAGTWTNIAFSLALVVSACALTHFVKMPKAAKVAILTWAVVTNSFWIFGELFYSALSASAKDHGDFGNIANNGPKHLAAASAGIIVIVLLSLIALQRIYLRRY